MNLGRHCLFQCWSCGSVHSGCVVRTTALWNQFIDLSWQILVTTERHWLCANFLQSFFSRQSIFAAKQRSCSSVVMRHRHSHNLVDKDNNLVDKVNRNRKRQNLRISSLGSFVKHDQIVIIKHIKLCYFTQNYQPFMMIWNVHNA